MYNIAFFCIPAHGHTNPTLEVVRELTARGHRVWYFSCEPFREKIEAAGAVFVSCDAYEPRMELREKDASRIAQDIGFSIRLLTKTTLALDEMVCRRLCEIKAHCVVGDSMALWGKFAALKLGLPFVCSTTTFAFNRHAAKIMPQGLSQMLALLRAMPSVKRDIKELRAHGYPVKNLLSFLRSDDDVNTIVYTSKEFQPCAETFSDRFSFVGPSIREPMCAVLPPSADLPMVYVSMGTVNNEMPDFYRHCIEALRDGKYRTVLSVGQGTDIAALGEVPDHITVSPFVDQIGVLRQTSVFLSHAGMNSVSESLYEGVPLVLFPQTTEQKGVANRVAQLHAGVLLKKDSALAIRAAVDTVLADESFSKNAARIAQSFRRSGGAAAAADAILRAVGDSVANREGQR